MATRGRPRKKVVGRGHRKYEISEYGYLGDQFIIYMSDGWSKAEVLRELDLSNRALHSYLHGPDAEVLKERMEIAEEYCRGWWEKQGRENIKSKEFNAALYFMHMRNRFKWTNNDNIINHQHSGNVQIEIVKFCEEKKAHEKNTDNI